MTGSGIDGCHACPIRGRGLCGTLSEQDLAALARVREAPRRVAPGRDLFSQGEPADEVFNILDGWAFLYELLDDGRRQILRFAIPGDLVGLRIAGGVSQFGAQAIDHVVLCVIPRRRLMGFAHEHPGVALRLMSMLSSDEQLAYERITSIGRKTALERISSLLLELFYRLRHRPPQVTGEELRLPLTQPLIADATGLTPIHTNRMLGELRHRGIIDYGNGLFRILDPVGLFEAAGVDPDLCAWSPDLAAE
ncbi:MAG: Crp/Fnr family transcriptional regulator [Magnetospirillum sp.]|nr:Crp/Fnr family transcriptional regulator [Magnetospirillum sp.]